jgi:hypothetical protein
MSPVSTSVPLERDQEIRSSEEKEGGNEEKEIGSGDL